MKTYNQRVTAIMARQQWKNPADRKNYVQLTYSDRSNLLARQLSNARRYLGPSIIVDNADLLAATSIVEWSDRGAVFTPPPHRENAAQLQSVEKDRARELFETIADVLSLSRRDKRGPLWHVIEYLDLHLDLADADAATDRITWCDLVRACRNYLQKEGSENGL